MEYSIWTADHNPADDSYGSRVPQPQVSLQQGKAYRGCDGEECNRILGPMSRAEAESLDKVYCRSCAAERERKAREAK